MFDFTGRAVFVGDEVIIVEPYYHNLIRGLIVKFTPKGIKVKYKTHSDYERETFVYNGEFVLIKN